MDSKHKRRNAMSTPAIQIATESPKQVVLRSPILIGSPRVFVDPPKIHIGRGDSKLKSIQWVNQTGGEVLIWLPNAYNYLEGKPEDFVTPRRIPAGGILPLTVRQDCVDGEYDYHVFCKAIKGNGYAEGNSPPIAACP
jgi:hypothetical protein